MTSRRKQDDDEKGLVNLFERDQIFCQNPSVTNKFQID